MAPAPTKRQKKGRRELQTPNPETKRRMLEAAADLIRVDGFPQLRIEQVTERAGVSIGTFYLYFGSKDDLFVELVVDYTERLRRRLRQAISAEGSFAERMTGTLSAYFDFVEESAGGFLYFRDLGRLETTGGRLSTWALDQHAADLEPVLQEAMARGEIRRDDATLLAQVLLGLTQHLAGFWLEHREQTSREELEQFITRLLVSALSPAPDARGGGEAATGKDRT